MRTTFPEMVQRARVNLCCGPVKVGAYRDAEGALHAVSAICTHRGCVVAWNAVDTSWDCPCHGSRFDHDDHVLQGPAQRELEVKRIEAAIASS